MFVTLQQFPLWVKGQVVAAISQSRRVLYAGKQTRLEIAATKLELLVAL